MTQKRTPYQLSDADTLLIQLVLTHNEVLAQKLVAEKEKLAAMHASEPHTKEKCEAYALARNDIVDCQLVFEMVNAIYAHNGTAVPSKLVLDVLCQTAVRLLYAYVPAARVEVEKLVVMKEEETQKHLNKTLAPSFDDKEDAIAWAIHSNKFS